MSCNGCRILRKGCNDVCILRQSLIGIESSQAQANATLFVAKFFGRAGLMSFLSSVPQSQRPALFQSLLFEACGRTVNPVCGAVGLLGMGNWDACQSAVETVLHGGVPHALPEFVNNNNNNNNNNSNNNNNNTTTDLYGSQDMNMRLKRKSSSGTYSTLLFDNNNIETAPTTILMSHGVDLSLTAGITARMTAGGRVNRRSDKRRMASPSDEQSETTTLESNFACHQDLQYVNNNGHHQTKLLKLFF